jgi:NAD(P)-dependent dehydrogenase (short-subunit alcohol dehydrogenase family)
MDYQPIENHGLIGDVHTVAPTGGCRFVVSYKRVGEPDDTAQAAVWLASDAASHMNRSALFVDGGMTPYPGFATGG